MLDLKTCDTLWIIRVKFKGYLGSPFFKVSNLLVVSLWGLGSPLFTVSNLLIVPLWGTTMLGVSSL